MVHRTGRAILAALGAVALAAWATWPLAAHLRTHVYDPTRHGGFVVESIRADVRLVLWVLAWDVHALTTAPAHLWDANIFHPARHTLALSEHLLGALPVYAPLALASGDPVFAHQATLLLSFAGALLAMGALARAWTGDDAAAVLAATLFAFSPFRGAHLGALQIEGSWMLPLVVLAAWRSAGSRGVGWPIALAVAVAATALHSIYLAYGVFAAAAVLVATAAALDARTRAAWRRLVLPLVAAALVVAATAVPYLAMRAAGALHDPRDEFVALTSASLGQTGATLAVVVAALGAAWWRRGLVAPVRPAWLAAVAAAGVVAHLLAIGPALHVGSVAVPGPYALAAALVPGFETLRIPLRLNAFATVAAALLAGIGAAGVARAVPAPRLATGATLALAVVAAAGLGRVPLEPIETRATLPAIYTALSAAPDGPVLEVPWHDFDVLPMERGPDALRTYRSVYHWRRLLNGYSGYAPHVYPLVSALAHAAPAPEALALLARATGLRWVIVHGAELDATAAAAWERAPVSLVARAGTDALYALAAPPSPDLAATLAADAPATATLTGTPLVPLAPDGRVARVHAVAAPPTAAHRRLRFALDVAVTNASVRTWPSLATAAPHLVTLAAKWSRDDGSTVPSDDVAGRLPWDLPPGGTAPAEVGVRAPDEPGAWRLTVGVVQDGVWLDGDPLSVTVEVR